MGTSQNQETPQNYSYTKTNNFQEIGEVSGNLKFWRHIIYIYIICMCVNTKTSFSSALKKAASRARIKEGRTACKQTLQSAVHLHAPPSQDSGGK